MERRMSMGRAYGRVCIAPMVPAPAARLNTGDSPDDGGGPPGIRRTRAGGWLRP